MAGVYYRGEKIGFTVRETLPSGDGFEVQDDGRLHVSLLGHDLRSRTDVGVPR